MERELSEKAGKVRLLILDVDGVMTEGKIVYNDKGEEIKSFDVKDGHAIKLLQGAGVKVGVISSRSSRVVEIRAKELGIEDLYQGSLKKIDAYEQLLDKHGLSPIETAFMGDDLMDIAVLKRVGFSAAVADAASEVREVVDYVTRSPGGRGAVREVAEIILKARGLWQGIIKGYSA